MNGATIEQCKELSEWVDEFEMHAKLTGQDLQFRELIDKCRFHFRAYAEYQQSGLSHLEYKAFLDARRSDEC